MSNSDKLSLHQSILAALPIYQSISAASKYSDAVVRYIYRDLDGMVVYQKVCTCEPGNGRDQSEDAAAIAELLADRDGLEFIRT